MTRLKKTMLSENQLPTQWYNITADMKNKPLPFLHPATLKPVRKEDLSAIFPDALIEQELATARFIDIPEQVQDVYKLWRATPIVRAYALEKALDTPAKIYFKNESINPVGSHKPNSAIPQAYYNSKEGIRRITTETGGGQWGSAVAFACQYFNMEANVFMVRVSYDQKPYRKFMMNTWGARVIPSPSRETEAGKSYLASDENHHGSLGIAISEAVEMAAGDPQTNYMIGSALNHVLLHQTIIGEEAVRQMEMLGELPDIVIGCFGGGSNFSGLAFPFLRMNLTQQKAIRAIAVEPQACPKLTRGTFQYDFGDTSGLTPLIPMFTLGHDFQPDDIHAGGLRYHGAGAIVSQLLKDGEIEAQAVPQIETFEAALLFARTEGIIPAPESAYAIAQAIREGKKAKEEGRGTTILFNLSGHGVVDLYAYEQYFAGKLKDYSVPDEVIRKSLDSLQKIV